MFSRLWWKATLERMAKSAAQGFILAAGGDALGWLTLDWAQVGMATAGMAVLSFAASIITTPIGPDPSNPSAV